MDRRLLALATAALAACTACTAGESATTAAPTTIPAASTPATARASAPAPTPSIPAGTASAPGPGRSTPAPSSSTSAAPLTARVVAAQGLANPWGVAVLPDGAALMTQRASRDVMFLARPGDTPRAVGTLPDMVSQAEGGALGLALAPGFASNPSVYAYYTTATDNRVAVMRWDGARLSAPTTILSGIPKASYHDGGGLAFGPDGKLYVATGDAKNGSLAQDRGSLAGKILRLEPDGSVPADNPFPGSPVWSLGHRNVQGLAWDRAGRMVASEFGESRVDEVNIITKGANYGWPQVEGPGGADRGFVDPVATWSPTSECSPSGIAFDADATSLFVGCLRGQHVSRITWRDGAPAAPERFVTDLGRVRGVTVDGQGRLWAWTDNGADDVVVLLPR